MALPDELLSALTRPFSQHQGTLQPSNTQTMSPFLARHGAMPIWPSFVTISLRAISTVVSRNLDGKVSKRSSRSGMTLRSVMPEGGDGPAFLDRVSKLWPRMESNLFRSNQSKKKKKGWTSLCLSDVSRQNFWKSP